MPEELHKKLEPKSRMVIFLGIESGQPYAVYDEKIPEAKNIQKFITSPLRNDKEKVVDIIPTNASKFICGNGKYYGRSYLRIEGYSKFGDQPQTLYFWDSNQHSSGFDIVAESLKETFKIKSEAEIKAAAYISEGYKTKYLNYVISIVEGRPFALYVPASAFNNAIGLKPNASTLDQFNGA
ncbi:MAG: hypothetical protein QXN59_00185 [Candidatus Micrarchaeaceae archaeon]